MACSRLFATCSVGDILREAWVIWGARLADNAGTARRSERRAAIAEEERGVEKKQESTD